MNPQKKQPEDVIPHLEQMMVNMHDNAQHGNAISENILEKTAEHTQTVAPLLEHQLLKQDEAVKKLDEIKTVLERPEEPKPEIQKVSLEGVSVITIKGDKGDKGDSPSLEELESVILPLIPDPVKGDKGDSPTPEEIVSLITPLIPKPIKGDKGDKPTAEEIKALIPPPVPGPKGKSIKGDKGDDGKDAIVQVAEIVSLINPLLEYSQIKNAPQFKPTGFAGTGYLREITDVEILTDPTDGQTLVWSSSKRKWIAGSSSGAGVWYQDEILTRTNGIDYSLAHSPSSVLFLYLNGQLLINITDYTRSGTAIAMVATTLSTDILTATYS